MEATSGSTAAQCHLFRLPAELREYIYELVIWPQPAEQRHEPDNFGSKRLACKNPLGYHLSDAYKPPALLAVNRQIRIDANKIFYSRSIFFRYTFDGLKARLGGWLRSLEPVDRVLVKSFKLDEDHDLGRKKFPNVAVKKNELIELGMRDFEHTALLEVAVKDDSAAEGWRYMKVQEILDAKH